MRGLYPYGLFAAGSGERVEETYSCQHFILYLIILYVYMYRILSKNLPLLKFVPKSLVGKSILIVMNFLFYGSGKLTLIIRHQPDANSKVPSDRLPRAEQLKFLVTHGIYDSLLFVKYIFSNFTMNSFTAKEKQ